MICHFTAAVVSLTLRRWDRQSFCSPSSQRPLGNATVFATLGLFGRGIGLSEFEVGAIFASSALLFFLTSSHWGRLSDRIGRTPVMVVGLAGTTVSLFLFAGLYRANWPGALIGLLAARMIYGVLAGGIQPAAVATMADTTTAERRAAGVALVGAAVGIGSIAGPILTAALVGFGLPVPVAIAGIVTALAAISTFVGARDGRQRPMMVASTTAPSIDGLRPYLLLTFAMVLGFGALQPTTAFYVQDRFHLDTAVAIQEASLASASFAACSFVVQVFVVRALHLGSRGLLRFGLAICLLGIGGGVLAPASVWLIAAFGVLGAGYGLAQSGLTAAASIVGGEHRQGQIAGRLQAVMSAAWIVGALGGTTLYAFSIAAPLLLAAVGMAFALAQMRRWNWSWLSARKTTSTAPSARMVADVRNNSPHTGSSNSGRGVTTVFTPVWTIARAQSVQGKYVDTSAPPSVAIPRLAASKIAERSACSSQMKRLSPTTRSGRFLTPGGKLLQPEISVLPSPVTSTAPTLRISFGLPAAAEIACSSSRSTMSASQASQAIG